MWQCITEHVLLIFRYSGNSHPPNHLPTYSSTRSRELSRKMTPGRVHPLSLAVSGPLRDPCHIPQAMHRLASLLCITGGSVCGGRKPADAAAACGAAAVCPALTVTQPALLACASPMTPHTARCTCRSSVLHSFRDYPPPLFRTSTPTPHPNPARSFHLQGAHEVTRCGRLVLRYWGTDHH